MIDFGFTRGDVIVVTGAASGIGRSIALRAAELGLSVAAWDINAAGVQDTVETIGGAVPAMALVADVDDQAAVQDALARSAELGPLRHLANVAGPPASAPLPYDDAIRMSLGSMRRVTTAWLDRGVPPGASLVNMASIAGNLVGTAPDWYSSAKAGIVGFTRHLAAYRSGEVRANAVGPGMTDTPRLAGYAASPRGHQSLSRIPLKRMATPDDIGWPTLFLLSPLASYVNGAYLVVDGGWMVTQ